MPTSPELRTAIRVLEAFQEVDPDITLPSMLAFLYTAEQDSQSGNQDAVTQRLGMSGATASRTVGHWQEYKRPRTPGLGMINSIPDPEDRRYRMLMLSRKGLDFLKKVKGSVNGTSQGE